MKYILGALLAVPFVAVLLLVASAIEGYCLHILWGWFVVPLGVPGINIPSAIGISLVAGLLTHQHQHRPKEVDSDDKWTALVRVFVNPFLVLLIGYITTLFL